MNAKKHINTTFLNILITALLLVFCIIVCIKLTKFNDELDSINADIKKIEKNSIPENIEKRFNKLENNITSNDKDIKSLNNRVSSIDTTVLVLFSKLNTTEEGTSDSSDEGSSEKEESKNITTHILSIVSLILSFINIAFIALLFFKIKVLFKMREEVFNNNTQKITPPNNNSYIENEIKNLGEKLKKDLWKEQNKWMEELEKKQNYLPNSNNKSSDPIKKVYFELPVQLSVDKGYFKKYSEEQENKSYFEAEILGNIAAFKPLKSVKLGDWLSSDYVKFALDCEKGFPSYDEVKKMEVVSEGKAEKNEKNEWIIKEKAKVKFIK